MNEIILAIEDVLNIMEENYFVLTNTFQESHYYFEYRDTCISLVTPHKGTDFKYMIRAEKKIDFDKWGNAQYEEFFSSEKELIEILQDLKQLKRYVDLETLLFEISIEKRNQHTSSTDELTLVIHPATKEALFLEENISFLNQLKGFSISTDNLFENLYEFSILKK